MTMKSQQRKEQQQQDIDDNFSNKNKQEAAKSIYQHKPTN